MAGPPAVFASTHWSVVLEAGHEASPHAAAALDQLCRAYWYPLYAYIRRRGFDAHEAQDLTQEFLTRLIAKRELPKANPEKGRFRFFLLLRLKHFLINEWERIRAEKRGGGRAAISLNALAAEERYALEPVHERAPDQLFERRWALTLLERVLGRLRQEWSEDGPANQFEALKEFLSLDGEPASYEELSARLGSSVGALKVAVHRLRARCRELLCEEIAHTVSGPAEVDAELRHFLDALRGL
jgi:RNA polymerase sigma-70 factor (ECF subfamily)